MRSRPSFLTPLIAALALGAVPTTAHAGLADRWYGYQIMLSDLTFSATAGIGSREEGSPLSYVGLAGLLAAPAVIHLAHGEGTSALVSIGVRGLLGGMTARYILDEDLPVNGAILWGGLAIMGMIYDWTYNAVEDAPADTAVPHTVLSFATAF